MRRRHFCAAVVALVAAGAPAGAAGQGSHTYHLHREASNLDGLDLEVSGPDAPTTVFSAAVSSTQVGQTTWFRTFNLPWNVPALSGVMPAGTRVTFTLWMRKTAERGIVYPAASTTNMFPGGFSGSIGPYQHYCSSRASAALTTTLAPYTFDCTITQTMPVDPTDRFTVWVSYYVATYTPAKGKNGGMSVQLGVEGSLNGSTDSRISLTLPPNPRITSVSPGTAAPGSLLTVSGANFGVAQGASVVRVNGAVGAIASWNSNRIETGLPTGVARGPVGVSVDGLASNTWMFEGLWSETQCQPQLATRRLSFSNLAGQQTLTLTAPGCAWGIGPTPEWLTVSPQVGFGDATLQVTAAANSTSLARSATLWINSLPVGVMQSYGASWGTRAHASPTISVSGGTATCTLAAASGSAGNILFMGMDLYLNDVRIGSNAAAGDAFTLAASGPASSADAPLLRCIAYSLPDGFVVSETPPSTP